jgi:N-formylglutamate amidohydrolase
LITRFSELGYSVTRNKPYAGGFITEHYGRPLKGFHAVQIEINRSLYVDELTLLPKAGFETLKEDIRNVLNYLVSIPDSRFEPTPIAAE